MKEQSVLGCGSYYDERHGVYIHWFDEREPWLVRHEVFHGTNRKKSIELGLYVFITPAAHNMANYGVHFNRPFEKHLQEVSQRRAMDYYGWSLDDWMKIIGRNYLNVEEL